MKINYFRKLTVSLFFAFPAILWAQDSCSPTAPLITVNPSTSCASTTAGTTVGATLSQAGCAGNADDDVWYRFTATSSTHTVTVTPGTLNDAVLQVFSGTCGALTSLGCADATFGTSAETMSLSSLTAGTTYYVRVYSWAATGQGTFSLCVGTIVPVNNDNCSSATQLTPSATCMLTSGSTIGASQSMAALTCNNFTGNSDDDVWYRFTATSTAHNITVAGQGSFDAVVDLRTGACNGSTIGCADATFSGGTETINATGLTIGSEYYIRVYSFGTASGSFSICVTSFTPASYDNCNTAGVVPVNSTTTCTSTVTGTTVSATQSQSACSGTADDDVWYSFTATSSAHSVTITPGTLSDAVFEVLSGGCGSLTSLGCANATIGSSQETLSLSGLTSGMTYFIRIYSYSAGSGQGTFTLCIATITPPANDNCAGAVTIPVNTSSSCVSTATGTSAGATLSQSGCAGTADDDVWYSFTATSANHSVTVTPGTLNDAVLQVFSGGCGALTSAGCTDLTVGAGTESLSLNGLIPGNTYFIRVYSYASGGGPGTFSLCVSTYVPPTPCTFGPGTGTTALGCPSVISGGLGLNGADPSPIDCQSGSCVDLEATYLQLGQTSDYTVESIPYNPPYQFGCLANPVSVNIDDVWSPVITLPFNFCFYGNTYNQCLISSNGAISFDTTTYSPGGYSQWSFSQNLPSTSLFLNSIFGVYHDIDPSISGEVGWELITLNTGCRALVASWNDIAMYSAACNSMLYTGMIVLYENTNVIEVYIKEKNVCASWNSGNAIVGLQNSNASMSAVAPNRNGLDANWTVTNEAWRFVPAGATITSLAWYEGATAAGPVLGTGDVLNVCPSTTTTYTAQVTYSLCNGASLVETESTTVTVNLNKIWNGSVSTDWNTAANWTPVGVPTSMDCVVIAPAPNNAIISGTSYDAFAYSLAVLNNGVLLQQPSNNLTVTNAVAVQPGGSFTMKNSASLLQINNSSNSGTVTMERITPPVYRFDYTYWNSPMTFGSGFTLGMLSPNTQFDKYYSWNPSVSGGMGIWSQESTATVMDPRKGYIVRAPNSYSFTPDVTAPYVANFIGTPNNGNIICPITYGSLGPASNYDKWNLIGNPYPSPVDASDFITHSSNSSVIDGTLYFWTHNSPISASFPDPFYGDYVLNYTDADYAAWNLLGGTTAISGGTAPSGYIAAGQSFFTRSLAVPGSATFTNSMRVTDNNAEFFKSGDDHENIASPAGSMRLWLNLRSEAGAFSQILIGYAESATMDYDRGLDGLQMNEGGADFYSIIGEIPAVIQARPLPFDIADQVPVGIITQASGEYSIRIDHFDAAFENINIYLEDLLLGTINDLKLSPYFFSAEPGQQNSRFVVRYTEAALGVTFDGIAQGPVTAYFHNGTMQVQAYDEIESVTIFDVAGKLLARRKCEGRYFSENLVLAKGVYPVIIQLRDGSRAIRKLMN